MADVQKQAETTLKASKTPREASHFTLINALEQNDGKTANSSDLQNQDPQNPNSTSLVKTLLIDHRIKKEQDTAKFNLNKLHQESGQDSALRPNFFFHGQEFRFAERSLFVFTAHNRFRKGIVWLITHSYFDPLVTIVILLNSVILMLNSFNERIEQPYPYPALQAFLDTADQALLLVYIAEFILKVLGMGFLFGTCTYLKSGSNIFDFVLVIYGIVEYFAQEFFSKVSWISIIRTIRTFKILRTFKSLKKLKVILNSLLIAFQNLTNVLSFLIIFMIAAAGIGTYMLRGRLEDRCRYTETPAFGEQVWPIVTNTSSFLCGYKSCPTGTFCKSEDEFGLVANDGIIDNSMDLNFGITKFDNLLYSLMSVFIIILGEGWTSILYIYWNSAHPLFCTTFMIILILVGNMILINLFLGLISYTFDRVISEAKSKNDLGADSKKLKDPDEEQDGLQEELDAVAQQVPKDETKMPEPEHGQAPVVNGGVVDRPTPTLSEVAGPTVQKPTLPQLDVEAGSPTTQPRASPHDDLSKHPDDSGNTSTVNLRSPLPQKVKTKESTIQDTTPRSKRPKKVVDGVTLFEGPVKLWEGKDVDQLILKEQEPLKTSFLKIKRGGVGEWISRLFLSKTFSAIRISMILFNSIILGLVKYPQSKSEDAFLTNSNNILSICFFVEVVILMWGGGLKNFFKDWFNVVDGLITIANLISTFIGWASSQAVLPGSNYFAAFRIFRIMKLINIAGSWKTFRVQMRTTWMAIKDMRDFLILVLLYLVISSLLSTELFAYRTLFENSTKGPLRGGFPKSGKASDYYSPRLNFDSFWSSFITNFTLIVLDGWYDIMFDVYRTTDNKLYLLYFIVLVTIGNLILLNLFLAILINNFVSSRENYKEDEEKTALTYSLGIWFTEVVALKFRSLLNRTADLLSTKSDANSNKGKSPSIILEEEMLKPYVPLEGCETYHKHFDYRLFPMTIYPGSELAKLAKQSEGLLIRKYTRIVHLQGNTFFCISPENPLRRCLFFILKKPFFVKLNTGLAIFSALCLAFTDPLKSPDHWQNLGVNILRQVFGYYFVAKMFLEILTFGLCFNGPESYMSHGMNILEFFTNILFLLHPLGSNFKYFKQIGILRLVYAIDVFGTVVKSANTKVVLKSLILSLPSILSLMAIEFVFFYALGIVNVNLFRGQFFYCDTVNVANSVRSTIATRSDCINLGGDWVEPVQHFDNVIFSMGIIFRLVTTDDWSSVMYGMMDSAGVNKNPILNNRALYAWYAVGLVVICHLLILNIFAGVVMETFISEKDRLGGYYLLNKTQSEWLDAQTFALKIDVKEKVPKPKSTFLYWFYKFFLFSRAGGVWEFFSIIFSVLPFTLIYHRMSEGYSKAVDIMILGTWILLTLEVFLKVLAYRKEFFRSFDTMSDLSFVILESIGFILNRAGFTNQMPTVINLLRCSRVMRIFRMTRFVKKGSMIFDILLLAFSYLSNMIFFILVFIIIYTVIGMNVFPYIKFRSGITSQANFTTFGLAFSTLLRVCTGEGWNALMNDCLMKLRPNDVCMDIYDYAEFEAAGKAFIGCGNSFGHLFYISFIVIFSYVLLNLFTGIVIESFYLRARLSNFRVDTHQIKNFARKWREYDTKSSGFLSCADAKLVFQSLSPPLGIKNAQSNPYLVNEVFKQLRLPIYRDKTNKLNCVHMYDLLLGLMKHTLLAHESYSEMETCKIPLHLEVERERIRRLEQYQDSNMVKTPYTTYQEFYVPFIAVMMRYNHEKKARVLTSKRHPESEDKPRRKVSETAKEQAPRRRNAVLVEEVLRIQEQQLQINQASNKIAQEDSLSSYRSAISSVDSHKPSGRISGNATKKQFLIEQRIQQLKEMERKQKIRQRKQQIESKIKEVEHSKKAHSVKRGDMSPSNNSSSSDPQSQAVANHSFAGAMALKTVKPPLGIETSEDSKSSKPQSNKPPSQILLVRSNKSGSQWGEKPVNQKPERAVSVAEHTLVLHQPSSPTGSVFSRGQSDGFGTDTMKRSPDFVRPGSPVEPAIKISNTLLADHSFGKVEASLNQMSFGESKPNIISEGENEPKSSQDKPAKLQETSPQNPKKANISEFSIRPVEVTTSVRKRSLSLQAIEEKHAEDFIDPESLNQNSVELIKTKSTNQISGRKQSNIYQSATDLGVNKTFGEKQGNQSREKLNRTFDSGSWMFQKDPYVPESPTTKHPRADPENSRDSLDATMEQWGHRDLGPEGWKIPTSKQPSKPVQNLPKQGSLSYASALLDEEYHSSRNGKHNVESEDGQNYPTAIYEIANQDDNSFEIVKPQAKQAPKLISIRDMAESTSLRPAIFSSAPEFDLSAGAKSSHGSKYDYDGGTQYESAQESLDFLTNNRNDDLLKPVPLEDIMASKYGSKPKKSGRKKKQDAVSQPAPPKLQSGLKPLDEPADMSASKTSHKDTDSPGKGTKGNKRLQIMGGRVLKPYGTDGEKIKEKLKEINEPFTEAVESNIYYQKQVMLRMMEEKQKKLKTILSASKQSRQDEVLDDMLLNPPTKANLALLMAREAEDF